MSVSQLVFAACTVALQTSAGADLIPFPAKARCFDMIVPARPPQDTRWIDHDSDITATATIPQCANTAPTRALAPGLANDDVPTLNNVSANQIPAPSTAAIVGLVGVLAVRRKR